MRATLTSKNRHTSRRDAALRRLAACGPFIEGNLCAFKRPGCSQPGWHLTFKQKGKTRTVYVPVDLVAEVKTWTSQYRQLKKHVREVTRHALAIIQNHAASQRAARRSPARTRPKPPKP